MAAGGWLLPTDSDLPAGTVPKSEPAFEVLILRVLRTEQCQKNGGGGHMPKRDSEKAPVPAQHILFPAAHPAPELCSPFLHTLHGEDGPCAKGDACLQTGEYVNSLGEMGILLCHGFKLCSPVQLQP